MMILIYILIRLFINKPYTLEGDELRHLACAKNFYKLWNKSFYDFHPPLYSLLIRIFGAKWWSGVLVSLMSSIGLYFICLRLYDVLDLTPYQKIIAMAFLTFNYTLIYYSNRIFRYQLIALLGMATLYFLLIHKAFIGGLCWGLLALTCSFAGLRGFWIWLLTMTGTHWLPLMIFELFYGGWLWKKASVYCRHDYYPSGQEGKIELVRNFTWRQLFSPMYFPFTYAYYGKKELGYDFKNWHKKIGGIFGLYFTKNRKFNFAIGGLVIVAGFFTIKGMLSGPLWLVILTLALLWPSLYKRFLPRHSIMAIPLLGFFLAKGMLPLNSTILLICIVGLVVGFLALNHTWILTQPKIKAKTTSYILNYLPNDGILAEGLIAYPIAYQSDKRVVVIPHEPDELLAIQQINLSIREFDLHYAVFSELYKTELHLGYPAIDYIKSFKLLREIKEDNDTYYIYEIK